MNEPSKKEKFLKWWQSFFFEPTSPTPIAWFRIAIGIVTLQCLCIHLLSDWSLYFGDHPLITIETMIGKYWRYDPYFDLMLLLPSQEIWRWYFFWVTVAFATMMTFGLFTRFSSVATFLCMMSLQHHFLINQNSGDNFLRIGLLFVAMSNAGDALSIDNLLRATRQDWRKEGFRPPLSAPWAQRMLQIQLCIAYFHTFWCKIAGEDWNNGTAVYYASRYDDIIRFPLPYLLDDLNVIKILTWGTLVVELALCTLIWWRPVRYWIIILGVALHLGIEYTMNLPMFEWLFISSYLLFIYPEHYSQAMDAVKAWIHKNIAKPSDLIFDGNCIFCVRTVGLIHRLDIFGMVRLHNFRDLGDIDWKSEVNEERAEKEILLRKPDGKWLGGFAAFRYMAGRMPWLMLLAPFLYLPGIAQIGDAVYKLVAANRYVLLGGKCDHKTCTLAAK